MKPSRAKPRAASTARPQRLSVRDSESPMGPMGTCAVGQHTGSSLLQQPNFPFCCSFYWGGGATEACA